MKKLFILLVFITSTLGWAQWSNESHLFIVYNGQKVSSFVDQNGTHIVYYYNGAIKYAYVNGSGTLIRYDVTIENSNSDLANIVSDGNNLYAVYKRNDQIKISKSTNLGANWNTSFGNPYNLIHTGCNEIKSKIDGEYIHIVWSEYRSGSNNYYDVHYVRFRHLNTVWDQYQLVTDVENYGYDWDFPAIDLTSTKIYVSYRTNHQAIRVRTKEISTGTWNTPESVPIDQSFLYEIDDRITPIVKFNDLLTSNDRVNSIFKIDWSGYQYSGSYVSQAYKLSSGGSWQLGESFNSEKDSPDLHPVVSTKTANLLHVIYWDKDLSQYTHRSINGNYWSSPIAYIGLNNSNFLSSSGNDLYLIKASPTSIIYRKYDQAPLTPANFTVSIHQVGNDRYPKFNWSLNTEPDVRVNSTDGYTIERRTKSVRDWSNWQTITAEPGTTSQWIDYSINTAGGGAEEAEYKIKAKDIGGHSSGFSNVLNISFGMGWEQKLSFGDGFTNYDLFHNYPNPFNPSTVIKFQIPAEGLVSLKVYDILGREVADLVNEFKPAGSYEASFDGSSLSSGVYFYRLVSRDYTSIKKMLMVK
jgi:hypothetical protein